MKNLRFEISHTGKTVNRSYRIVILMHVPREFVVTETLNVDSMPWRIWRTNHNGIWLSKKARSVKKRKYERYTHRNMAPRSKRNGKTELSFYDKNKVRLEKRERRS